MESLATSAGSTRGRCPQNIRLSTINSANSFTSVLNGGTSFGLNSNRNTGLDSSGRTMIVCTTVHESDGLGPSDDAEWIGTLSILSPKRLLQAPRDKPLPLHIMDAEEMGHIEVYMIIGVWVHPEQRRRGIGRLMVERALEIIRADPWVHSAGFPSPVTATVDGGQSTAVEKPKRLALLHVREANDGARELYSKIGFVMETDTTDEDLRGNSDWMTYSFDK